MVLKAKNLGYFEKSNLLNKNFPQSFRVQPVKMTIINPGSGTPFDEKETAFGSISIWESPLGSLP